MLNEFVRWMSERKSDRRAADRKRVQFGVAWLRGTGRVPGIGTEISLNGLLFATKSPPEQGAFNAVLDLAGRRIAARLVTVRTESAVRDGTAWTMLACRFEGIAADDYDAIVRFVRDLPEPPEKPHAFAAAGSDDAYRLLPMPVQERIVRMLVAAHRISAETDSRNPLLRMKYLGARGGKHHFAVHSRMAAGDEIRGFDSSFSVDDSGNVTLDR